MLAAGSRPGAALPGRAASAQLLRGQSSGGGWWESESQHLARLSGKLDPLKVACSAGKLTSVFYIKAWLFLASRVIVCLQGQACGSPFSRTHNSHTLCPQKVAPVASMAQACTVHTTLAPKPCCPKSGPISLSPIGTS